MDIRTKKFQSNVKLRFASTECLFFVLLFKKDKFYKI